MKQPQLSSIPAAWGGPFIWAENERGNLALVRLTDLADTAEGVVEVVRKMHEASS